MRVLIVEDEVHLAEALRDGLTAEGLAVDLAFDGERGLLLARENPYDAIVLDLMIPRLSGYEVCRTLRREQVWTPVLILTAKDGEYDQADALDLGADVATVPAGLAARRGEAVAALPGAQGRLADAGGGDHVTNAERFLGAGHPV